MNRKFLVLFFTIIATICCTFGLAACTKDEPGNSTSEHKHKMVYHEAIEETCTEGGNIAYWSCTECGKNYQDEAGTVEAQSVEIAASGHDWGDWTTRKAATCQESGEEYRICLNCSLEEKRTAEKLSHDLQHFSYQSATCENTGVKEYWQCSMCEKYFLDEQGVSETAYENLIIEKSLHESEEYVAVSATCTQDGNKAYYQCRICAKYFWDSSCSLKATWDEIVVPASHTMVNHARKAATCAEEGNKEYWECTVCHKCFWDENAENEIEDLTSTVLAREPHEVSGFISDGSYHWKECKNCKEVFEKEDHVWDDGVITREPTCLGIGEKTYTCSVCEKTKTETLKMLGHEFSEEWISDWENHWHKCIRCSEIDQKLSHEWDAGTVVKEPTCTESGSTEYQCTVCEAHKTETVPARHTFSSDWISNDEYHWRKCEFCETVTDKAAHNPGEDKICTECGYVYNYTIGLSFNAINGNTEYEVTMGTKVTDKEIVIPESFNGLPVTSIASSAFFMTDITSIYIPSSVRKIGTQAFFACTKLEAVYITDVAAWCSIEFESDTTATANPLKYGQLYVNGKLANTLVIPDEVRTINSSVFWGCQTIQNIVVGANVEVVGTNAFRYCDNLTKVFYKGTDEEAWNQIQIGNNNDKLIEATRYYYREENPFVGEGAVESGNFWRFDTDGVAPVVWIKENI